MNYRYHPDARQEASTAVAYYAAISQELGVDFLTELENGISRIVKMPKAWANHMAGTRRWSLAPLSLRDRLSDRIGRDSDSRSYAPPS